MTIEVQVKSLRGEKRTKSDSTRKRTFNYFKRKAIKILGLSCLEIHTQPVGSGLPLSVGEEAPGSSPDLGRLFPFGFAIPKHLQGRNKEDIEPDSSYYCLLRLGLL